jgi:hypothetical protein
MGKEKPVAHVVHCRGHADLAENALKIAVIGNAVQRRHQQPPGAP